MLPPPSRNSHTLQFPRGWQSGGRQQKGRMVKKESNLYRDVGF